MTLNAKIKTLEKLRGGMTAAAFGPTFRRYFILKPKFPSISYFNPLTFL
jgi:hypothetical protein